MDLPHELLDEILSYLPLQDEQGRRSLQNCSLVAKSWTNPCRRRLFEKVEIRQAALRSWLKSIPPANHELLQHIRSLSYVTNARGWGGQYRIDILCDYLPFFNRLQHLTLSYMSILLSQQIEIFSSFRHTLSRLSLEHCNVTVSALVTLINYFPRLDRLDLSFVFPEADGEPVPSLSRPPIRELDIHYTCAFRQLSKFGLVFDEVVVYGEGHLYMDALSEIVDDVGVKAQRLRLLNHFQARQPGDGSTLLSRCPKLQELGLAIEHPTTNEVVVLSSVTSTCLQKVSLIHRYSYFGSSWRELDWKVFNEPLCRLVDQSGCTRKLEVDIRPEDKLPTRSGEKDGLRIADSLARFREKGQIRVFWVDEDENESIIYPFPPPL